ncbi:MAG: polysaccharide pyruvyl transferase family protein [Clostridia bacterium]|nr:polysaccharide pyruvyl transferase family protein [Clostridia bacterium]
MNIGLITFHWATNHGAILQTWATVRYLESLGHKVSVIDYYPPALKTSLKSALRPSRHWLSQWKTWRKEKKLAVFRDRLPLTEHFSSLNELGHASLSFDAVLCGSDQIWNYHFLTRGEGRPTPAYFLPFVPDETKKIALAVSFGCESYPENAAALAAPLIDRFFRVSVREKSGLSILRSMGQSGVLVADPVSLIPAGDLKQFCCCEAPSSFTATCILRSQPKAVKRRIRALLRREGHPVRDLSLLSMEDWISGICHAETVVTNSFHCTLMCLKLHTPFYVLTEEGALSGMNDRLVSLLSRFGLTDRIVSSDSMPTPSPIFWEAVDEAMEQYSATLKNFIHEALMNE